MNKILMALVLAVGLSGNAYAEETYLYCSNNDTPDYEKVYGYFIESNKQTNFLYYYQSSSDKIAKRSFSTGWSSKYIAFTQNSNERDGQFSISREDLTMYKKGSSIADPYVAWGKCELIADEGMLKSKVAKFYSQKQNNNKF